MVQRRVIRPEQKKPFLDGQLYEIRMSAVETVDPFVPIFNCHARMRKI